MKFKIIIMIKDKGKTDFDYNQPIKLPAGILGRVIKRIYSEKDLKKIHRLITITGLFLFLIIIILLPVLVLLWINFANSGFLYFLILVFLDLKAVILNWQNFIYLLLELIPVTELIAFLVFLLGCLIVIKILLQYRQTSVQIKKIILKLKR